MDVVSEIRALASRKGLNLKEVASAIGEDYDNFYAAIKGRSAKRMEQIKPKLELLLGYSSFELSEMPMVPIPVIGFADAGPGYGNESDLSDERLLVPQFIYRPGDVGFQIPINSYSMSPWLMPGDIIVVEPRKTPAFGLAMLVRKPSGERSVKVVQHKAGQIFLESVNPDFDDDRSPFEIEGLVVGYFRDDLGEVFYRASRRGLKPVSSF